MRAGRPTGGIAPSGPSDASDALAVASTLDVFAACLASGMAVSTAAGAAAPSAPRPLANVLDRAADLLALGSDPATAWSNPALPLDDQRRCATAAGTAIGCVGYRTRPRCHRVGREFPSRCRIGCRCQGAARLGSDRGPPRVVLPTGLRLPGHRPDRRRAGGGRAALGPDMTADKPHDVPTGRKRNGSEHDSRYEDTIGGVAGRRHGHVDGLLADALHKGFRRRMHRGLRRIPSSRTARHVDGPRRLTGPVHGDCSTGPPAATVLQWHRRSHHRESTAHLGEANAAHTPSPVCLNNQPPCASTAARNTASCAARAACIALASASHRAGRTPRHR